MEIRQSNVYSGTDRRKHQNSASVAFVSGIHRWPVNSQHKGPVMWKMFPFDDVIMTIADLYFMRLSRTKSIFFSTNFPWKYHMRCHIQVYLDAFSRDLLWISIMEMYLKNNFETNNHFVDWVHFLSSEQWADIRIFDVPQLANYSLLTYLYDHHYFIM